MPPKKKLNDAEEVQKVKLHVRDLRPGMYVRDLDRPWLDSPFLFQGFEVKNWVDIEAVQEHCEYVYVDLLRSKTDVPPGVAAPDIDNPRVPRNKAPMAKEMAEAETARRQTSDLVKTLADDIRFGQSVDVQMAREAVSGCIASIMRNADAMMFMTQMRAKSEAIGQHALNSCVYAVVVGRNMGLSDKALEDLGTCGLLHDLGMVNVPDEILHKPAKLNPDEFAVMRQHARQGRDILMSGRNIFSGCVDVAYGHHEHMDGSGYPRGLTQSQINLNCRIVAVVDKYDALLSQRPHRPPRSHLDAIAVLNRQVKSDHVDPDVVRNFISYLGIFPPGCIVELSSGETAIVLETNPTQRLRPQILVVRDAEQEPVARFVDLAITPTDEANRPLKIKTVLPAGHQGINVLDYREVISQSLS